ncbi:MAG: cardiolipin synthase [Deltaproteobacteria bacterium]|jgi:cardiolipin synthase|nr:cardiolipin synthase [Deltaproteobacteria bacterium]
MLWTLGLLLILLGLYSAGHALLNKRDPRAALGWISVCLLLPAAGPFLYWTAGINRVRTRAKNWQESGTGLPLIKARLCPWPQGASDAQQPKEFQTYRALLNLADMVTRRPLLPGNQVTPLFNGEQAYPEMLACIEKAKRTVYLSTYIFETNSTGQSFIDSLIAAADRGVDVRFLVDALGECYSWPLAHRKLRGTKVKTARFLPFSLGGRGFYVNLRNHRKLLIIDDTFGFTGGMNIGDRHVAKYGGNVQDLHFLIEGPVVTHLQEAFLEDWTFATGDVVELPPPPTLTEQKGAFCRGISAGPNEDFEKLIWLIIGAMNNAHQSIRIMTPYFIPDRTLLTCISAAAMRGVQVEIILPERSNLPYVDWASRAYLWELLQRHVRIYLQPSPFAHTKYLLVDDLFSLVGSANLDPRSLRLNFEFNLEVYDHQLNQQLTDHFKATLSNSLAVKQQHLDDRRIPTKLRDAFFKLFSPYL